MNRRHRHGSALAGRAIVAVGLVGLVGLVVTGGGCLDRPVVSSNPSGTLVFTSNVVNESIDKLDILFMIDNSSSMGDKQALLAAAIPDMINRLVTPNCLDASGDVLGPSDMNGTCAEGGTVEFPPVHDMHIGIVTSSIGSLYPTNPPAYLSQTQNQCDPAALNPAKMALGAHADDRGELIDRGGDTEAPVANANPLHFLAWFPPASQVPANAGAAPPPVPAETQVGATDQPGTLIGDFAAMVSGVNEHGCGFEAQNEAWYRFLIQPDPYDHVEVTAGSNSTVETEVGVDSVILAQRAAFLRPDSLVAVIAVTDENEDHYDPLALGGQGWLYEQDPFPGAPQSQSGAYEGAPEGTIECSAPTDPNNPTTTGPYASACASCGFTSVQMAASFATRCPPDPPDGTGGFLAEADDGINVRFYQPKRRFGVAPYYPVSRYVRGLTSATVPDRATEHDSSGNYVGDQDAHAPCVNPLFAASLPTDATQELCALAPGPRTPDLVFFAAITGVPHQLLQTDPTNPDSPQKDALTDADWQAITGRDPDHYDFTGADPHMLESEAARSTTCPPTSNDDCDPINGREYVTNDQDVQFACIFPFVDPTTGQPRTKDCTATQYTGACDCSAGNLHQKTPLCLKDANGNYTTTQIQGKAYPCLRELEVAHAMGAQGIVSSLCPIHPAPVPVGNPSDPLFGYRPAVNAIIDRLKTVFIAQCVPEKLTVDPQTGQVPCLLLAMMNQDAGSPESDVCDHPDQGLSLPETDILARFLQPKHDAWVVAGGARTGTPDPDTIPVCQMNQITNTSAAYQACQSGGNAVPPGWCYVEGGKTCPQQVLFTFGEPPRGSIVSLQCLEKTSSAVGGGN